MREELFSRFRKALRAFLRSRSDETLLVLNAIIECELTRRLEHRKALIRATIEGWRYDSSEKGSRSPGE